MIGLLAAMILLAGGGLLALLTSRSPRLCNSFGAGGCVAAALVGVLPVLQALTGTGLEQRGVSLPWDVPYGEFRVELDSLSAFFVLPVLLLGALAALAGASTCLTQTDRCRGEGAAGEGHSPPSHWLAYNFLLAGLLLVLTARNAVLFLVAWEGMTLAAWLLIQGSPKEDRETKTPDDVSSRAGWTFLVAGHLGAACLMVLFVLLGSDRGVWLPGPEAAAPHAIPSSLLLMLALVGFGAKAGFMPLHVWLPETYPAVPGHVAAVLSGVMSKAGIYGLLRTLTFLETPPVWWAWVLIGVGLVSGVLGILGAQAQRDLRRLLAYSSIENIGIIALGLGVGLLGLAHGVRGLAVLGFAGALLHVLNHSLFKGLLFIAAGAVVQSTGTADLERLGGLLKPKPWTAVCFAVGALAICGLPPLNGFASEFLIYLGAFKQEMTLGGLTAVPPLAVIAGLALIGGLAAASFTKAFGIAFLGSPRSVEAEQARPTPWLVRAPMLILAGGCVLVGFLAPWLLGVLHPTVDVLVAKSGAAVAVVTAASSLEVVPLPVGELDIAAGTLKWVVLVGVLLLGLIGGLTLLRWRLLRGRTVAESETWGCGYAAPTARMQYTASSFTQPLTELFHPVVGTYDTERPIIKDYFPPDVSLATETPDLTREYGYRPLFLAFRWVAQRLRFLQQGRVQVYVLYIALAIFLLLIWYLGIAA
jgi:hydrogenase-4 component B